jgi:DNA-binding transcriptional LysR family regulator
MSYITSMSTIDESVDVPLLRTFDALLTHRHVTRAARQLGVTQSAASHSLSRLRRWLDDPLFVRGSQGILPTARAIALGPEVRALLERIDALARPDAPFDASRLTRTFVLGGADYTEIILLPRLVRAATRSAPHVDYASRPTDAGVELALESGAIDVAIGVFPTASPRLVRRKLLDESFVCMLRRGHPALKRPLTVERFAELSHVLISPRGSGGGAVDDALTAVGTRRRIAARTATFAAAPIIVSETDCVVTLPTRIARAMSTGRRLVLVPPPVRVAGFTLSLLFHERRRNEPAHAWLRDQLATAAAAV